GELRLEGVTVAYNHARTAGGGVVSASEATTIVHNTLVATNQAIVSSPDLAGTFSSSSFNLVGDATGSEGLEHGVAGNQLGTFASPIDPKILGLADNLGRTRTHALLPSSPAIDAGDITGIGTIDQRGIARAQDGNSDGSHRWDVGAYELGTFMPTLDTITNPVAIDEDSSEQSISLNGLTAGGDDNQPLLVEAQSDNSELVTNLTVTYTSPHATGNISYLPGKDRNGLAVITVAVSDAGLDGIIGNVDDLRFSRSFTVAVTPVNDDPVAHPVTLRPAENSPFEKDKAHGLAALTDDVDNDTLTFSLANPPDHGQLVLNEDGSYRYTPNANFNRTDSFGYRAHDGQVASDIATVTLTIDTEYAWYNFEEPRDVNHDDLVTPLDVLWIINAINNMGSHELAKSRNEGVVAPYFDVNRDRHATPLDALWIINYLNQQPAGEGEQASATWNHAWVPESQTNNSTTQTRRLGQANHSVAGATGATDQPTLDNTPYTEHVDQTFHQLGERDLGALATNRGLGDDQTDWWDFLEEEMSPSAG
ncbi:MAG: Ig-like domain-containing protein, partial [Pirellulaceae bacterium]